MTANYDIALAAEKVRQAEAACDTISLDRDDISLTDEQRAAIDAVRHARTLFDGAFPS